MRDDNIALTGNDGEVARSAYLDFLSARGMADTPDSYRVFVELLSERKTRLSNSGQPNLGVDGEKQFYADAALERLRARSVGEGPIELAPEDRWMISALSDPSVKLTDTDRALLNRTQWHDNGLRRNLGEWAAKQAAAFAPQPGIGQPFSTWLNLANVLHGDPQRDPYVMAAKHAGYTDAEIDFALEYYKSHGITSLFVDRGQAGQPPITRGDQVQPVNFGGQDFVLFNMSKEGAELLRDARYAKRHGFDSVDAYRDDFNNSLSDMVGRAGTTVLKFEQDRDKFFDLDEAPILGPLVRGKYDAIGGFTLAASNAAQFIESFKHFFVRISDDEELMRYYRNTSARAEQTHDDMRRTYPQQENGLGDEIVRSVTASVPSFLGPHYEIFLHANHSLDTAVAAAVLNGVSFAAAGAPGRLASGASGFASKRLAKLVNDKFVQETVQQLVARGTAGITNATAGVAITASIEPARTDPEWANMTDAQKAQATRQAYARNAVRGFVLGLLMPGAHREQDFVTLSKPGTQLEGPLVRMPSPEGGKRYYGVAKVTEGSKTRMEMIEVDPSSPKARQLIEAGRVQDAQQRDVLAVLQARYQRLPPAAQAKLIEDANHAARAQTLADAENGVLASRSAKAGAPPGQLQKAPEPVNTKTPEPASLTAPPAPAAATASLRPTTATEPTAPKSPLPPEGAAGRLTRGAPPAPGEPMSVHERLETADKVAREVEWYALNGWKTADIRGLEGDFATCTRAALDTSIKLSRRGIEHNLAVYNSYSDGIYVGRHAVVELPDGQVVTYGRVFRSRADLEKSRGRTYTVEFPGDLPGDLKDYIARQSTQSSTGIASYPHQFTDLVPFEPYIPVEPGNAPPQAGREFYRSPAKAPPPPLATGAPSRGDPPGEPKSAGEQYVEMMTIAKQVAEDVESYAMNSADKAEDRGFVEAFDTCARAALDTSIKLSLRGVTHDLAGYIVFHNGVANALHAVVELPRGEVVTHGRVYKSIADFEKWEDVVCIEAFRGDPEQYIVHLSDKGEAIVSYPHQYTLKEMIEAQTRNREMVPFERGEVPRGSQAQYRGEEFTFLQYDTATGKPILFQKGRGKDRATPELFVVLGFPMRFGSFVEVTEAELKAKYDEIFVNGETRLIDKENHAHIHSAADRGNGTFLVGADPQYVIWDEAREPGALRMWGR